MTVKAIYFDMDGTIANFYGVENWLEYLMNRDVTPYANAKPLIRFCTFARMLNKVQRNGWKIGIVSWLAKNSTEDFDERVTKAKLDWLSKHLPSVKWDEIKIVKYGTPKQEVVNNPFGILFDDEEQNRTRWDNNNGVAFDETEIMEVLKMVAQTIFNARIMPTGAAGRAMYENKNIFYFLKNS